MGQTLENELEAPPANQPAEPPAQDSAETPDKMQAEALEAIRTSAELSPTMLSALGAYIYNVSRDMSPPVPFSELPPGVQERFSQQAVFAAKCFFGLHTPTPGEIAYTNYASYRTWQGFNGDLLPTFKDALPEIQAGWEISARAVLEMFSLDAPSEPKWLFQPGDRVRHSKSGNEYTVVMGEEASVRIERNTAPAYTYTEGECLWVRPAAEMEERFVLVESKGRRKLKPHERRLLLEKAGLEIRLKKLREFIDTNPEFAKCSDAEQKRLRHQLAAMTEYDDVLTERCATFGTTATAE